MIKYLLLSFLALTAYGDTDPVVKWPTYEVSTGLFSPPTNPTDMCTIRGSATKTVYVKRVEVSATQTTAGVNTIYLVKRSSDNDGGGINLLTEIALDSNSAAAAASTLFYSSNPVLGTSTGTLRSAHMFTPASGTASAPSLVLWDFKEDGSDQPIVLRGAGELLAVYFNLIGAPAGFSINCNFHWYER